MSMFSFFRQRYAPLPTDVPSFPIPLPFVTQSGVDLGNNPVQNDVLNEFKKIGRHDAFMDVSADLDRYINGEDFATVTARMTPPQIEQHYNECWDRFQNTQLVPAINRMVPPDAAIGRLSSRRRACPSPAEFRRQKIHDPLSHLEFFATNLYTKPGSFYNAVNRSLLQMEQNEVRINAKAYDDDKKIFNVWFYLFLSGLQKLIVPVPALFLSVPVVVPPLLSRSAQVLADATYELLVQQECTSPDRTYQLATIFDSTVSPNLHHLRPADRSIRLLDVLSAQPERFVLIEPGRQAVYAINAGTVRLYRGVQLDSDLSNSLWKRPDVWEKKGREALGKFLPDQDQIVKDHEINYYTSLGFSSYTTSVVIACQFSEMTRYTQKLPNVIVYEPHSGKISLPSLRFVSDTAGEDEFLMFPNHELMIYSREDGVLQSDILNERCTLSPTPINWIGMTDASDSSLREGIKPTKTRSGGAKRTRARRARARRVRAKRTRARRTRVSYINKKK